jgi:4-hydroxy-tetrahydrodipicolinate synthase
MRITSDTSGVFVIAVTPFLPDGAVDFASVDRVSDFYFERGADGLTVLGILGEAQKLAGDEAIAVARRFIARTPDKPIIVGVSAPGFASMRRVTHETMSAGAAGVMIAPPSTLRTEDQILTYYRQAAEAIGPDVPVCVQDHPSITHVHMSVSVLGKMMIEHDNFVMLKHEESPGLDKLTAIRAGQRDGTQKPVSILCGNGGIFLDFEMDRGADGAMTGYAFPEMLVDLFKYTKAGDREAAHDIYDAHLPLLRYEQQPGMGLAIRKNILVRRGAIQHETLRVPGPRVSAETLSEIDYLLSRLAKKDPRALNGYRRSIWPFKMLDVSQGGELAIPENGDCQCPNSAYDDGGNSADQRSRGACTERTKFI